MSILTDKGSGMSTAQDIAEQAARNVPASAVAFFAWLTAVPLANWLTTLLIIYTALQIYVIVKDRIYKPYKRANKPDDDDIVDLTGPSS